MGTTGSQPTPEQGEQTVVPPDEPKQEQYVANWYTLCGAENSTVELDYFLDGSGAIGTSSATGCYLRWVGCKCFGSAYSLSLAQMLALQQQASGGGGATGTATSFLQERVDVQRAHYYISGKTTKRARQTRLKDSSMAASTSAGFVPDQMERKERTSQHLYDQLAALETGGRTAAESGSGAKDDGSPTKVDEDVVNTGADGWVPQECLAYCTNSDGNLNCAGLTYDLSTQVCYFINFSPVQGVSWPLPESREQNRANLELHMPPQQGKSQEEVEKTTITIYQKSMDFAAVPGVKLSWQQLADRMHTDLTPLRPEEWLRKSFCVAKKSLDDGAEPSFKDFITYVKIREPESNTQCQALLTPTTSSPTTTTTTTTSKEGTSSSGASGSGAQGEGEDQTTPGDADGGGESGHPIDGEDGDQAGQQGNTTTSAPAGGDGKGTEGEDDVNTLWAVLVVLSVFCVIALAIAFAIIFCVTNNSDEEGQSTSRPQDQIPPPQPGKRASVRASTNLPGHLGIVDGTRSSKKAGPRGARVSTTSSGDRASTTGSRASAKADIGPLVKSATASFSTPRKDDEGAATSTFAERITISQQRASVRASSRGSQVNLQGDIYHATDPDPGRPSQSKRLPKKPGLSALAARAEKL
ncbi:unnamed protein product [Amoebophrya sp. A120]|nr:unnamed protein product [Amoebophrya sp. A120]|eukprot:GSA120T00008721001.1